MNKVWLSLSFITCTSILISLIAFILVAAQAFNFSIPISFFPLENIRISIVFYLTSLSLLTAWLTNVIIKKFIDSSKPISLDCVESYIQLAKDIGLLVENKEAISEQNDQNSEESLQQAQDELQCELELLLNELHRLLIASWFDGVSPDDPDFPRATRQALARASVELQSRAGTISPNEAAKIVLTLIISHLRNVKAQHENRSTPLEDGSAELILMDISEALVSSLLAPEISAPPGGTLLAALLSHGALRRALALVTDPGWLCLHLAQLISGESVPYTSPEVAPDEELLSVLQETTALPEVLQCDPDMEAAVQEACTPCDDTPDLISWPSELGEVGPKLWGTCSAQPEQPSLPQIVEPSASGSIIYQPAIRKASEAEWLNPSPPRQHLGLQLSKSSHDLSQVSVSFARDAVNEELRSIKFPPLPTPTSHKEMSLGCHVREEASLFGSKVREASSDVLGSLKAKASSHLSALLSPARDTPPVHAPSLQEPVDDESDSVSPVYEEASDLASSIAKLKALLQHHEHKSSTDDEDLNGQITENPDEQPKNTPMWGRQAEVDLSDSTKPMWGRQAEIDQTDSEWMEAEEAPELPDDGRPFMNICIPATELSCDASGQQFVQYCIQYDAVYVQEGEDGPRLVLQTTTVKRRFQEFLNLQNRLEETPIYRSALRGVKGPSRWLSLAFSKAGQQTTAARLPVLERFLQQLCEQPVLARSPALKHFLAYGSQRAMAFTKQGSELHRLDKILARTVSGVFHSIKTALPSFDFELSPANSVQQLHSGNPGEELGRTSSLPSFLGLTRAQPRVNQPLVFMEKPAMARDVSRDIHKFLAARVEPASEAWDEDPISSRKASLAFPAMAMTGPIVAHTYYVVPEKSQEDQSGDELTGLFEELLALMLPGYWIISSPLPKAIRCLLQNWTERKLQNIASELWSLQSAVILLRLCRAALAPDAVVLKASKDEGQTALKSAINKSLPAWLQLILGSSYVTYFQNLVVEAVSHEGANQELALKVALSTTYLMLATQPKQQVSPISYC